MPRKQSNPVVIRLPVKMKTRPWTDAEVKRLTEYCRQFKNGIPWPPIALELRRSRESCIGKWQTLIGNRKSEYVQKPKKAEVAPAPDSIVPAAEMTLLAAGFSELQVKIMSLDERMLTANRVRHAKGMPLLGKKAEWLAV